MDRVSERKIYSIGITALANRSFQLVIGIFLFALILRLTYALGVNYPLYSDMVIYDDNALEIVSGHGIPATGQAGDQYPLYSLFLAGIYAIWGHNFQAVWIIQAFIGAITCVLVVRFAQQLGCNLWISGLAGGLTAIFPDLILYCGLLLSDTVYTFLLVLTLLLWQAALLDGSKRLYFATGIVIGLGVLTRSAILFFFPLGLLLQIIILRPKLITALRNVTLIVIGILLIWGPWLLRNQQNYGVMLTSNAMGFGFWGGNNAFADGTWTNNKHITPEQMNNITSISPTEANRYAFQQGMDWILGNPKQFLILLIKKIHVLFSIKPDNMYKGNFYGPLSELFIPAIAKAILWLLVAVGLVVTITNRRKFGLLYCLLIGHLIMTLILFGYARYLIPLIPALAVFAAQGVESLIKKRQNIMKHPQVITPYWVVICIILFLLLGNWLVEIYQYGNLVQGWLNSSNSTCRMQSVESLRDCLPSQLK